MRSKWLGTVLSLALALPAAGQTLYGVGAGSLAPLSIVDPATGGISTLGNMNFTVRDLAGGDALWGVGFNFDPLLVKINPADQSLLSSVVITAPERLDALATRPSDGGLFAAAGADGTGLYQIDPTTGIASSVGDLGTSLTSLAFDNTGRLYGSWRSSLYEIDPATADVQLITDTLPVDRFEDLAFDPSDNTLLGLGYDGEYQLFEIDPATAAVTSIGLSVFRPAGLAFVNDPCHVDGGDLDGDGFASQADLDLVLLNWGATELPAGWVDEGAFDGVQVSQNELDQVLLNWGGGTPPDSSVAAVPEPGAGLLLGGLAWGLGRRRA